MKKQIVMILALMLLLTACSAGQNPTEPVQTLPATVPEASQTEPELTEPPVVSMEMGKTELWNDRNCRFTVKSALQNAHVGMTLEVEMENKTDKTLLFCWNNTSVNGFMFDPGWSEEVTAGKTTAGTVYFDTFRMADFGIESADEITFTLFVYDSDDFMAAPLVNKTVTIYPTGLSGETMVYPQRVPVAGEQVVADTEEAAFIIESVAQTEEFYTLRCYLANRTEQNLMFSWEAVSVDGKAVDPMFFCAVGSDRQAVAQVAFRTSDLTACGITNPGSISFKLVAADYDDWEAPPILEQNFTFNP